MEAKLITAAVSVVIVLLSFLLIKKGWSSRQARQADFGDLAEVPEKYDSLEPLAAYPGTYITTTSEGDWLDRVSVESLGYKASSILFIFEDAIVMSRDGAKDLWIPREDITDVRYDSGINGKFVEKNGLLIVSWNLNGHPVDTGFRTQYAEDKKSAKTAIETISEILSTSHS